MGGIPGGGRKRERGEGKEEKGKKILGKEERGEEEGINRTGERDGERDGGWEDRRVGERMPKTLAEMRGENRREDGAVPKGREGDQREDREVGETRRGRGEERTIAGELRMNGAREEGNPAGERVKMPAGDPGEWIR